MTTADMLYDFDEITNRQIDRMRSLYGEDRDIAARIMLGLFDCQIASLERGRERLRKMIEGEDSNVVRGIDFSRARAPR